MAAALAIDPDSTFRTTHKRNDFVFKLNIGIATALVLSLVTGVVGIIAAVLLGRLPLGALGGGASAVSVVIGLVYKPLDRIQETLKEATNLDFLQAKCKTRLELCRELASLRDLMDCANEAWDEAIRGLHATAGKA